MKVKRTKRGATLYCTEQDLADIKAALHRITAEWVTKADVIDHLESGSGISTNEGQFREGLRSLITRNRQLLAELG